MVTLSGEQVSRKTTKRPQLQVMLQYLREEDALVACSIDRLARNLNDLKRLVDDLNQKKEVLFLKENLLLTG